MLHRHIDIEHISFHDLPSNHRFVNGYCDLFPRASVSHILSLVLYPDDLSDPLPSTVDERILRLDDPIEHFDPDDSRIAIENTPPEHGRGHHP